MEPKSLAPNSSQKLGAYSPQELPPQPGVLAGLRVEAAPERLAQQEQQPTGPFQAAPPPVPPVPPPPAAARPVVPVLNPIPVVDDTPVAAGDDEVIEKEWVDKAKKIVAQTKDDPYQQEKAVSRLQADYLKKRYGKDIKLSGD